MDDTAKTFYELRFRAQFLESKAAAFQDLFVEIMSKAHPGDFIPCRPWGRVGDRKNDGYLKSERTLFQVYAPNEMRASETIHKVESDFAEALPHWRDYFDTWVFVHNTDGGLPPEVISKLLDLERLNAPTKLTHWGYEELLLRLRRLSPESLCSLYGSPPTSGQAKRLRAGHSKSLLAQDLAREGKNSEAMKAMKEALAMARSDGDEGEEVEILVGLALLSSEHHGRGDRQHYFQQAEKKVGKLKSSAAKAIYFRASAAALEEKRDLAGAEAAYKAALDCCAEPEDDKGNLAIQACIVRCDLVHFLCNQKRLDEARQVLGECEDYARQNKDAEDGELLQAALEAAIHLSLEDGDEDGAIDRICDLERLASTSPLASRIRGDLVNIANNASHRKTHRAALAAAEAAIRVGQQCNDDLSATFLFGALYTEAMVIMQSGDDKRALNKAEALLGACRSPENAMIKQATQHLIAEIRRCSGDSQTAVDLAQLALDAARGRPEEIAFAKLALARALNDNGQTEEALKHAKDAWILARPSRLPTVNAVDFLSQITNYASQLGEEQEVGEALTELGQISEESDEVKVKKARAVARASANRRLRGRFIEVLEESEPAKAAGTTSCATLQEANANVIRPLLGLWEDMSECLSGSYDFWGRGNLERILLNARCFPNSFNVTIEVRSLDDVKRAVRLWGLYSDTLILVWKGPTDNGLAIIPFPEDYDGPGGWGYTVCSGDILEREGSEKTWHPAMAYASMLPQEVVVFLANEARSFFQSGRLIVVPAVGVGCINPGHGPFEQLLAEAANAIPNVRRMGSEGVPIGYIPYSPNAPFEVLGELAEIESERLRKLRLLLWRRSQELRSDNEVGLAAKRLSLEIDDALRDIEDRSDALTEKKGFAKTREQLRGTTTRFRLSGKKLADPAPESPFAPLLLLESLR